MDGKDKTRRSLPARLPAWLWILALPAVYCWNLYYQVSLGQSPAGSGSLINLAAPITILTPIFSVVVMALFVYTSAALVRRRAWAGGFLYLLAGMVILAATAYSAALASMWDQTSDGLSGLFILQLAGLTTLVCGILLSLVPSGGSRATGIIFILLVGGVVYAGFAAGWRIPFTETTQRRAGQVAAALQRFRQREGRYPQDLSELVPRDLLYVPQPVMFRGEGWCYQSRGEGYLLTSFYHEYFGLPVSQHVYAYGLPSDLETLDLPCSERLAEMQEKYDWTNLPAIPAPTVQATETIPSASPTPTLQPTVQEPTATPYPDPAVCSPLEGYSPADLTGMISNVFAPPAPGSDNPHQGVDFAIIDPANRIALSGNPVQAALPGVVALVINDRFPYGNAVIVETALEDIPTEWQQQAGLPTPAPTLAASSALTCPAFTTPPTVDSARRALYVLYAHMQSLDNISVGQTVACGQRLGVVGMSGNALNPHLHVEMRAAPAGMRLGSLAHYDASASQDEMAAYCLWRVSGLFQLVDPLPVLRVQP